MVVYVVRDIVGEPKRCASCTRHLIRVRSHVSDVGRDDARRVLASNRFIDNRLYTRISHTYKTKK